MLRTVQAMKCQRRHHRDETGIQNSPNRLWIYPRNLPHIPQLGPGNVSLQQAAVHAAEPHRAPAQAVYLRNQLLVDQSGKYRHHYIQAVRVGYPQSIDKPGWYPLPLHPLGYDIAAAVHHDHPDSLFLQGNEVLQAGIPVS